MQFHTEFLYYTLNMFCSCGLNVYTPLAVLQVRIVTQITETHTHTHTSSHHCLDKQTSIGITVAYRATIGNIETSITSFVPAQR